MISGRFSGSGKIKAGRELAITALMFPTDPNPNYWKLLISGANITPGFTMRILSGRLAKLSVVFLTLLYNASDER